MFSQTLPDVLTASSLRYADHDSPQRVHVRSNTARAQVLVTTAKHARLDRQTLQSKHASDFVINQHACNHSAVCVSKDTMKFAA